MSAYYDQGPLKEVIHNFKYNSLLELKDWIAMLLLRSLKRNDLSVDLITFVPMYYKALAKRGYNQSEILAKIVSKKLKVPVQPVLSKIKQTKRQALLSGKKRRENLLNAFKINDLVSVKKKNILIIDDVLTTGSTLNECAKILKEAGARQVWGLVIARR